MSAEEVARGRFAVEREIARGGMGAVYSVVERSTGRRMALKRLLEPSGRIAPMFEREFHTLASLEHPRIIKVYEYGIDDAGPYYTMELLEGHDLRDVAPLPFREASAYLRDVASSIALLHARRLLHRDLSPRNVRITPDGRAKLIDFGGLASFGIPDAVVGTPPCIAPEALHRASLDQRADLFALGALAYWVLTGRHAFAARSIDRLPEAWRTPPARPSEALAATSPAEQAVPAELDELVMSLLTLDPLGRPASAAEVIDRLTLIADLPAETDELASKSYLLGVETIGRDRERRALHERLRAARSGSGTCLVVEAAHGMGSSRMVAELSVDAQISGFLPVVIDCAAHRGPYGAVHAMIDKILLVAPDEARAAAAGRERILARVSPALGRALATDPDRSDLSAVPGELRRRTQNALLSWISRLCAQRPLLLAIDSLQYSDDASSGLLSALAADAHHLPLLLVACHEPNGVGSAPGVLRALQREGTVLELHGLTEEEVLKLNRLLFGDVEHVERLAAWMHRLTGGNPKACMDLAHHLVDTKAIRYIEGSWDLPQELSSTSIPENLDQILEARFDRLDTGARRLAEALSVNRWSILLEHCIAIAEEEGIAEPFEALEALARDNVLRSAGSSYRFTDDSLRRLLLDKLDPDRRARLHLAVGGLIRRDGSLDLDAKLDAGWHLLHGGDEAEGADLLAEAGLDLAYRSDEMTAALPALRAALDVFRKQKRDAHELLALLGPLTMAGYYCDHRLSVEFGEETNVLFERVLGLSVAARLRPFLGHLSLFMVLAVVAAGYIHRHGRSGIQRLREDIMVYIACLVTQGGTASICLDAPRAGDLARRIEPLAVFGSDHAASYAHRFALLVAQAPQERVVEIVEGCREIMKRLDDPRPIADMDPQARAMFRGGVLYTLGVLSGFYDNRDALACADELGSVGLELYAMAADQVRTNYYACRGEMRRAEAYRWQVERRAIQAGSAWQAEVWAPASLTMAYALTGDTIGLKRCYEQLDRLANEIPSLKRPAAIARSEYHHLKGDHEAGFALADPLFESTGPREFMGRSFCLATKARALNRLGRHEEAKTVAEGVIATLSEAERDVVTVYSDVFRELAHAEAGLGNFDAAFRIVDDLLERHQGSDHPLLMGNLHASATTVAIEAGDRARALEHVTQMDRWFRPTDNPALVSQCERMHRRVRRLIEGAAAGTGPGGQPLQTGASSTAASLEVSLSRCHDRDERARLALSLVLGDLPDSEGYLFECEDGEVRLLASSKDEGPTEDLCRQVRERVADFVELDGTTVFEPDGQGPPGKTGEDDPRYRVHVMTLPDRNVPRVVGAFAHVDSGSISQTPVGALLETVARCLFDSGETASAPMGTGSPD